MAEGDVAVRDVLVYKIGPIAVIIATMWVFRKSLKYHIHERAYAWILNRFAVKMNKGHVKSEKEKLFRQMFVYKGRVQRDLKVLEVGCGSCSNLEFFPLNTKLVTLDPNPHFLSYIQENLQNSKTVISADIVKGFAEEMPFSDDEFDVVISTLVLCTVSDVEKSLSEIRRVLKPGGLLLFIEHVAAEKKSWTWHLQGALQPVWKIIGDGCDTRRETEKYIRAAHFSKVSCDSIYFKKFPIFVRTCISGSATK